VGTPNKEDQAARVSPRKLKLKAFSQLQIQEKPCKSQVEGAKTRRGAAKMAEKTEKKKDSFNWLRRENRGEFKRNTSTESQ
jgi:hypothetical protein